MAKHVCSSGERRGGAGSFCYGNGGRANRKLVSTTCATNRRFRNFPGTRWRQRWDHTYPCQKHHYPATACKLFLSSLPLAAARPLTLSLTPAFILTSPLLYPPVVVSPPTCTAHREITA